MPNFRIFTESKADIKFIIDYAQEHFEITLTQEDFYSLGSWSGYRKDGTVIAAIRENSDDNKHSIVILDSDNDAGQRKEEVISDFRNYGIPINLFLFPNNAQNGSLETMLCSIAVKQDILRCFEGYEGCIHNYESPVIKSKVFAYLDALLPSSNKKGNKQDLIQEANRNYRNPAHWNLHHEYLQPLHNFLSPFFVEAK
jgi:hypothetical protein